jgi:hypothetical protein
MRRAVAPLAVSFGLALAPAARADDAAALYDPATVARIDLGLSPDAIAALADDPSEYVPATFGMQLGDETFAARPAELKLKGHASFRPLGKKAAFKLKFAKKDRFFGLKKLTLNNMVQDPSMVHETLGYEVLRAAGVPAPRTGFAYVRVNGEGYGVYLDLETYDDVSLARLFSTTQHLYEAGAAVDATPGGAGAYEVDEGDEDDRADLEALIAAANASGGDWSDGMAATADLGEMTRMWAGEQYLGHWDGYSVQAGEAAPNNYYLHSDAAGRFSMLPSGLDQTFHDADPFPGAGYSVLTGRCLGDASCLGDFRSQLGEVSAAADAMPVGQRLDAIAATVSPWRDCPHLEQATDTGWQQAVTHTRQFIRNRRNAVASYLGEPAPAPVPALESAVPPAISPTGCPFAPHPPPEEPKPEPTPTATPTPTPAATPPPADAGAVLGATASSPPRRLRPRRLTVHVSRGARLRVSGALRLPAGARCGGRVAVSVDAGGAMLAMRQVFLRRDCTYAARFRVPQRSALTIRARFLGTSRLLPRSAAPRTLRPRARARSASRGGR